MWVSANRIFVVFHCSPFWDETDPSVKGAGVPLVAPDSNATLDERIYAHAPPTVHALLAEAGVQLSAAEFKYWWRAQVGQGRVQHELHTPMQLA